MKISTKGTSRFLAQEDIPEEGIVAIIAEVRLETLKSNRGDEEKYVLYFTTGKPMVFNVVNRKTVVAAYGDDSDAWQGKPLEIYVNPDVTMGADVVGGIRLRIPKPTIRPAAKPTAAPPPPSSAAENLTLAISSLERVQTSAKADEWARWWKQLPDTTEGQDDTFTDAYHTALERIARAQAPTNTNRRPTPATT